mmetsp:Transcript_14989/g.34022  ORF Transcript_14989/g.34022 Transcript_14989/m.34022 type:complete len:80 (+) Transcript_14989:174-413(+)
MLCPTRQRMCRRLRRPTAAAAAALATMAARQTPTGFAGAVSQGHRAPLVLRRAKADEAGDSASAAGAQGKTRVATFAMG